MTPQPEHYQELFEQKFKGIEEEFSEFFPPALQTFESPPLHFRMRAEFKIWHEGEAAHYAMYQPGEYKKPIKIERFDIGSEKICALMPHLLRCINRSRILRRKLFQVEFLTTTSGDAIITLIYHKALEDDWLTEAKILENDLACKIIGRSRKQKVTLSDDSVVETFDVAGKTFRYQQVETGFTQPNAYICGKMLNWAVSKSDTLGGDLLELYCGNGNFTLPLASNFGKVLATEVSKTSVRSAQFNIALNNIENVQILRMSSEEFTQAMAKTREFRRLKEIDLDSYQFSTVFVDPPRAGLDDETEKLVSQFDNILYISCNPDTLKHNLKTLTVSHIIAAFAFFDQFPYTEHRELGVLLKRRCI